MKLVLYLWFQDDVTMPNPMTFQSLRAYGRPGYDRVFRHDVARSIIPILPADPHRFAFIEGPFIPAMDAIAPALQQLMSGFFVSDGATIPDVNSRMRPFFNGRDLIETPSRIPLDRYFVTTLAP